MGLRDALLRDIIDHPEDDTPRLVCADWLEENGDPARAEFIRVQCQLARPPDEEGAAHREQLTKRAQALFDEHRWRWMRELPRWAQSHQDGMHQYRRGFLAVMRGTGRQWLKGARALVRRAPLQRVEADNLTGVASDLTASPHLAQIRELSLIGPASGELREAAAYRPAQLTDLAVGPAPLADDDAACLVRRPLAEGLRRLALVHCQLADEAARAIAAAPALDGLAELDLSNNRLADDGAAALAASPHLAALTGLRLDGNWIGPAGAARLAAGTFTGLTTLDLDGSWGHPIRIESRGLAALAAAPFAPRLTRLSLRQAGVGPEGVEALAGCRSLRLRELDLSNDAIGDRGAAALAGSPAMTALRVLSLCATGVGTAGVEAIAASPHLGGLRELYLHYGSFADSAAAALADSPHLRGLRRLGVAGCFSDRGLARLRERFRGRIHV